MNSQISSTVANPTPAAPAPQPPPLAVLPEPGPAQSQNRASKPKARNGKIARLPKLERDMVNRMLADAIPHDKIAQALAQRGFKVTPRNVSNWATRGGFHQWCLDQALLLQTRLDQDTLTDFLRDDPTRLPEVGLQLMATRLSQTILRSELDPKQTFPLVAMLCRINHEILKLHAFRDRRCTIGNPGYKFERETKENTQQVETLRKIYSGEPVEAAEPKPRLTVAEIMNALRAGPQAAATLLARPSSKPAPPPTAQAQSSTGHLKPASPVPVPKPLKKPKSKTNKPPPTSPCTPHSTAPNPIEDQKSKIENPFNSGSEHSSTPAPPRAPETAQPSAPAAVTQIENQKSKIETGGLPLPVGEGRGEGNSAADHSSTPAPPRAPETAQPPCTLQPSTSSAGGSATATQIENQRPTPLPLPKFIDNVPQPPPPQQCPNCQNPLEYFLDGSPPAMNCPKCNTRLLKLYGHNVESCPACQNPLPPLLPKGLRPRRVCAVCGCGLANPKTPGPHPPVLELNARFCIHCRTPIPWQCEGARPSAYCAKCHRSLPRIVYSTAKPVSPFRESEEFTST